MPSTFGYWKLRGLAHPIRLVLTYGGEEFEDKLYECGPAPDYDRSCWLNEKFSFNLDFPNLPYYFDGKVRLTQSPAIIRYLARKYGLDGKTEDEKIRIDLLEAQLADLRSQFTQTCYSGDNFENLKQAYSKNLPDQLKLLSAFLGENKFFAGENLTYADFLAYEYFYHQQKWDPEILGNFSNLKQFYERFEAIPQLSQYIKNAPASKYPLNNKMARFGNE